MSILSRIQGPADVQALPHADLTALAQEIRQRLIEVTSRNGGHIGPNLGVVELTLGLHRVFNSPTDKFVFDVSHQGYVHKLLTGRNDAPFDKIRQSGGYSGFLARSESEHDAFGAGHAGTALSAALGMAIARDQQKEDNHVVAVLGDAAFTCGITLEALNNIDASTRRLIIILNDNEWSIAKNVGSLARYFNDIITNPVYNRIDRDLKSMLQKMPGGQSMLDFGRKWKRETKDFFVDSNFFETFGLRYIGPVDGHDIDAVIKHLEFAKASDRPILIHLMTQKGKGYEPALASPEKFHGLGPFDIETGLSPSGKGKSKALSYQDAFGKSLLKFAKTDASILGITAAMPPGTGLSWLRDAIPEQFFDVGIAEEHAVLFAAGLATQGMKPVVAIYSTFLQRAYDPIIHDICLQDLPVVFCMDRAGLSPNDGATHHGLFDIGYLRCVPNTIIMQPQDERELANMLWTSLQCPHPTFIRYPRGAGNGADINGDPEALEIGKAAVVKAGKDIQIWALGPWIQEALALSDSLEVELGLSIGVVNPRFIKPLDAELLQLQARDAELMVTMEDHVVTGGFGTAVLESLNEAGIHCPVERIGYPDHFIEHGSSVSDLRQLAGIDSDQLRERILKRFGHKPTKPGPSGSDKAHLRNPG
ncbi:MAG: 1-deoxy-D-xylulose-5-phosphate synthase [Opitutales bacterium]|nr:1-deoxy-D-xylulose-5-phosphate synthase [Opitutales bacterium]